MWKWFTGLGLVITICIVILSALWMRLPDLLSNHISEALGVPVDIKGTSFAWNSLGIQGITVANPPQTVQGKALTVDDIAINTPFSEYFKKEIIIEEIDVNGIYIDLEFDSASTTTGNWTKIMQSSKSQTNTKSSRSVLIKRLVLNDIKVDILYRKEATRVQRLPTINQIVLTNITSEGGVPMDQIMNSVLGQMLKSVFLQQNLKNMLQGILDSPENSVNKLLKPFRGFFNTTPPQVPPSE